MSQKLSAVVALVAMLLFMIPGLALAHATVSPKTVNANSYEKFVLRVPSEKASDTVKVRIEVPEGFAVSRVKPLAGWTYEFEKSADGATVKAIVWSGGKIGPTEFQEFEFQGKSAEKPGKYAFPVVQTYASGEVVNWTGPSDAQTPASFVEVQAAAGGTDAHGVTTAPAPTTTTAPASSPTPAAPAPAASAAKPNNAVAYTALGLAAVALALSLRRR